MKKIVFSIIVLILFIISILVVINEEKVPEPTITIEKNISLMEFSDYKKIKVDDIDYIEKIRYTEAGRDSNIVKDRSEITFTYNILSNKKVGSKTEKSCEDNTTSSKFYMKDSSSYSIEIECDVLVMGRNRYILK